MGSFFKISPVGEIRTINHKQTLISSTIHEWYDAKDRMTSDEKISLINNLNKKHCPYCGENNIVNNGFYKNGIQRYKWKFLGNVFRH